MSFRMLMGISSDATRQAHQVPYYLEGNSICIRTGDKLLSKFNQKIDLDGLQHMHYSRYQNVEGALAHLSRFILEDYELQLPCVNIILLLSENQHIMSVIQSMIGCAKKLEGDLYVQHTKRKFTEFEDQDDEIENELTVLTSENYSRMIGRLCQPKQPYIFYMKTNKNTLKINLLSINLQLNDKYGLVQTRLANIFHYAEPTLKPTTCRFNRSNSDNSIVVCAIPSLELPRKQQCLNCIKLIRIVENHKKVLAPTSNRRNPNQSQDKNLLLSLREQLNQTEKKRYGLAKRLHTIKNLYTEITTMLTDQLKTLQENGMKLSQLGQYKARLMDTQRNLEMKLEKQQADMAELKDKIERAAPKCFMERFRDVSRRMKSRVSQSNTSHAGSDKSRSAKMSTYNVNTGPTEEDLLTEISDSTKQLTQRMHRQQLQVRNKHSEEVESLKKEHKKQLQSLPQLSVLKKLLDTASKYPQLQPILGPYRQLLNF